MVRYLKYARLSPFDKGTESGRLAERYRLVVMAVLTSILSRGAAMIMLVVSVSLTLPYLGVEKFGVWMTILSMAGVLTFIDFGVGNALANRVAEVAVDGRGLKSAVSGGVVFVFLIAMFAGFILCVVSYFLPWDKIIKVDDLDVRSACMLFSVLFAMVILSNSLQKIFMGLQLAYEANFYTFIFVVISMFVVWLVARVEGGVIWLLLATFGVQQLVILVFLWRLKLMRIFSFREGVLSFATEKKFLLKAGVGFFILQLGGVVSTGIDGLLISSFLGVSSVAVFALVQRVFQFVSVPISLINAPLWGVYADAVVRGEYFFIRKTFRRSLIVSVLIAIAGGGVVVLASPWFFSIWTSGVIEAPFFLLIIYFALVVVESVGNSVAMLLNGCSILREQILIVSVLIVFGGIAKYIGVANFGVEGMMLGWLLMYSIAVLAYAYFWKKSISMKLHEGGCCD